MLLHSYFDEKRRIVALLGSPVRCYDCLYLCIVCVYRQGSGEAGAGFREADFAIQSRVAV